MRFEKAEKQTFMPAKSTDIRPRSRMMLPLSSNRDALRLGPGPALPAYSDETQPLPAPDPISGHTLSPLSDGMGSLSVTAPIQARKGEDASAASENADSENEAQPQNVPQRNDAQPQNVPQPENEPEEKQDWIEKDKRVDPSLIPDKKRIQWILDKKDGVQCFLDHRDGVGQAPIFETHSYCHSRFVDHEAGGLPLHSFIGLRFTLGECDGSYRRYRTVMGFGGDGLMDDSGTQSDVSTQTPISKNQLHKAAEEIPRLGAKKYNLFTYNCNHFTKEVAKLVGASVPAQLHDRALGPITATKGIASAATNGEQDRTRFFQGGTRKFGQMSSKYNKELIDNFYSTAAAAARRDLTPFLFYPALGAKAKGVESAVMPLRGYYDQMEQKDKNNNPISDFYFLKSGDAMDRLVGVVNAVKTAADDLIKLQLLLSHPRVNMAAMKVVALADDLQMALLPEEKWKLSDFSDADLNADLSELGAPKDSGKKGNQAADQSGAPEGSAAASVDNETLFSGKNSGTGTTGNAGRIFLAALDVDVGRITELHKNTGKLGDDAVEELTEKLKNAAEGKENDEGLKGIMAKCVALHGNLTDAQIGALAVASIWRIICESNSIEDEDNMKKEVGTEAYQNRKAYYKHLAALRETGLYVAQMRRNDTTDLISATEDKDEDIKEVIDDYHVTDDEELEPREHRSAVKHRKKAMENYNALERKLAELAGRARAQQGDKGDM